MLTKRSIDGWNGSRDILWLHLSLRLGRRHGLVLVDCWRWASRVFSY